MIFLIIIRINLKWYNGANAYACWPYFWGMDLWWVLEDFEGGKLGPASLPSDSSSNSDKKCWLKSLAINAPKKNDEIDEFVVLGKLKPWLFHVEL